VSQGCNASSLSACLKDALPRVAVPAAASTASIVALYREGAKEAYESVSLLHCPLANIVTAVSEAQASMAESDSLAPCQDPTGQAQEVYRHLVEQDPAWKKIPVFSLPGVTEVPSTRPAGQECAEPAQPALAPRTLLPWEIAPASFAALAMLADTVEACGGTDEFLKSIF
jgi:hypothetical protein